MGTSLQVEVGVGVHPPVAVLAHLVESDIIEAMTDEYSRKIMGSMVERGKTINEVSAENSIPISTSYRRMHRLCETGLVITERFVVSTDGKREAIYRSTLRRARLELEAGEFRVVGALNDEIPDISFRMWQFAQKRGSAP